MVAEPAHRLENLTQAFIVANVVADQVGKAHGKHNQQGNSLNPK
jgi:hypothetical protein